MDKVEVEIVIKGKTDYVRQRYGRQLQRVFEKHNFADIQFMRYPERIKVVAKE